MPQVKLKEERIRVPTGSAPARCQGGLPSSPAVHVGRLVPCQPLRRSGACANGPSYSFKRSLAAGLAFNDVDRERGRFLTEVSSTAPPGNSGATTSPLRSSEGCPSIYPPSEQFAHAGPYLKPSPLKPPMMNRPSNVENLSTIGCPSGLTS